MPYIKFESGEKITISSYFSYKPKEKGRKILLKMGKKDGYSCATFDMQEDCACFESISFCIWSIMNDCVITLEFPHYAWKKSFDGLRNDKRMLHYMRFLYRVCKMKELYGDRFEISDKNKDTIEVFSKLYDDAIQNGKLDYTVPKGKSSITEKSNTKVLENHLEKWVVLNGLESRYIKCPSDYKPFISQYYDQFPCDIFFEKDRLFCEGAIDLWGIDLNDDNQICIFELKKDGNNRIGILTELFFYSCVMLDIIKIANVKGKRGDYRGFRKFLEVADSNSGIRAYLLVPEFHSSISSRINTIIKEMNKRKDSKVKYDYILFDQNEIVSGDKESFIKKLKSEWENSNIVCN